MALPVLISAAALPAIAGTLFRFFIGTLIVRALTTIGFAVITYTSIDAIGSMIANHFNSLIASSGSGQPYQIALALGIPSAANIIFSAYLGSIAIQSAMGLMKRVTFGAGADS